MAILFTDIRGFTSLSERLSPAATFAFLNEYLARVGPLVRSHGGFIDKYVGDAIVALFPGPSSDALDAAIALQSEVRRLNEDRARRGDEPIAVGVGINYGRLMLGTIGESERFETTVIADSVNVASRLEGLTKTVGASILVSAALVEALTDRSRYGLRSLGEIDLRGHAEAQVVYDAFDGDPHELIIAKRRTLPAFDTALQAYLAGNYRQSAQLFDAIARTAPADGPAAYLRDRSQALAEATSRS
jgi:two-component system sensor histidine kinase ChiS